MPNITKEERARRLARKKELEYQARLKRINKHPFVWEPEHSTYRVLVSTTIEETVISPYWSRNNRIIVYSARDCPSRIARIGIGGAHYDDQLLKFVQDMDKAVQMFPTPYDKPTLKRIVELIVTECRKLGWDDVDDDDGDYDE